MSRSWHYVYYSYEQWGRGYIGKRSCRVPPDQDIKYLGSFCDKSFHPTEKIILAVFDTSEQALAAEICLHNFYCVDQNPHFANMSRQTTDRFAWSGNVTDLLTPKEQADRRQKWVKSLCSGAKGHFYRFISPSGTVHITINLREFCRNHLINRAHVYDCLKGRQSSVQGWTVTKHDFQ